MNRIHIYWLYSLWILLWTVTNSCAAEALLWQQFKEAKLSGTEPTLPDFSYAGYDYSETSLPDISGWAVFDVTNYGAIADDGVYDDAAIQAAIDATEAAGRGVVFFPAGRFMISPNETVGENIFINGSNIVLKGSGSGAGGTEIFMDKMKVESNRFIFEVSPTSTSESTVTTVVAASDRESYTIEVADASGLSEGQRIILRCESLAYAVAYFAPQTIDSDWTRLNETSGFNIRELHTVDSILGNTVTLREPLHLPMIMTADPIDVRTYNTISNVGVEDILFKGNWDSYPEVFEHHKDDIHDYAWNAIRFDNVVNGWMRNCQFKDWNQCVYIDGCAAFTVENVELTGKKGHASIHTRRSYGILIKDCVDTAGHHHGCGVGYWGCGTVYLRHQMATDQRMDSHSGSPYATLFDRVAGGHFNGNGGPHESYPHHAKYFVAWNFTVGGGPISYDFWPSSRNGNTFAMPIFAGLQGDAITINPGTFLENESPGVAVEPASLFEAQLQFRLGPTIDGLSGTTITPTRTTLNANLVSTGSAATVAGFYWGTTDGGKNAEAWAHFVDLGTTTAGAMITNLSSLNPSQTYYYRAWASNSFYEAWASQSGSFTTPPTITSSGSILNPDNFSAIEERVTNTTPALIFDTDALQVTGGLNGTGHLGKNKDDTQVAVFPFLDVNLTAEPIITGSRPIVIMSKADLRIDADINVDGSKGGHLVHGVGMSGGGDGGDANRMDDPTPSHSVDGEGQGATLGNTSGLDDYTPGGAGFGGAGGDGTGTGGIAYGDRFLSSLIGGSGAGGSLSKGGGAGGGAIALVATDTLEITNNASIDASGGIGTGSSTQLTSGGGSGGAILLRGKTVILNGRLRADGGKGGNAMGAQPNGGGGGGGRIAVFYHTSLDTAGSTLTVNGGLPVGVNAIGQPGGVGTIYLGLDDDGLADQWLSNETTILNPISVDWLVDYDGDGLSAILEYSLGGSTKTSDSALLPGLTLGGSCEFDFTYNRRQTGIDFADYIVESSTDRLLQEWPILAPEVVDVISHPTLSGFDRVTVRLPKGDSRRFVRLRIR